MLRKVRLSNDELETVVSKFSVIASKDRRYVKESIERISDLMRAKFSKGGYPSRDKIESTTYFIYEDTDGVTNTRVRHATKRGVWDFKLKEVRDD